MDAVARSLALRDPRAPARPSFPQLEKEAGASKGGRGRQITKEAIASVFFAEPWEPQSVLAKRGPVPLDGDERELTPIRPALPHPPSDDDISISKRRRRLGRDRGGVAADE